MKGYESCEQKLDVFFSSVPMCLPVMFFLPAQQLRIGEDLLQAVVVANAKGKDGLSRVAGKMPGYASREGQHHLPCDLHNTSETERGLILNKNNTHRFIN